MRFVLRLGPALVLALASVACAQPQVHAVLPPSGPPPGVSVTGLGEASGKPTIARATVGVEARAESAELALKDANARGAAVLAALRQSGVAEADIRTNNVSLDFERVYDPPPQPLSLPAGPAPRSSAGSSGKAPEAAPAVPVATMPRGFYRASNTVEVTVRQLDRVGQILAAAAAAGADQMSGVEFRIEDPSAIEAVARQKAMQSARSRAELLAQLAGLRLGRALSISEDVRSPRHMPMMMMKAQASNESSVPVASGDLNIEMGVQVVYELLDANTAPARP